jgi:uncharacterized membrane protein
LKGQPRGILQRSDLLGWVELLTLLGAFVIMVTYLSELRAENFFTTNWDLGVNQQLLWTTTHGSLLYDSGDYEFYGVHSFLQVHSTYLALLIAPIYSALPVPETLFAVQTTAFAASAVPLYLIGKSVIQRKVLLFVAILVYLTSFAVLSALLYDFHWEAFIPVEFLAFFLLVQRRRFALSLVPLFAGTLTLEVFPFLAGGVVLFFLIERLNSRKWTWKRVLADRDFRVLAGFLVIAGLTYVVLRVLQYLLIPHLLGVSGSTAGASNAITSPFSLGATSTTLGHSALYWLLILGCLGFLPLLSPKHLILSLPWFVESTFFDPPFSSHFGNQYALLAMAGVAVAFVNGLGKLESSALATPFRAGVVLALLTEASGLTVFAAFGGGSRTLLSGAVGGLVWAAIVCGPLVALVLVWVARRRRIRSLTVDERPRLRWMRRAHVPLLVGLLAVLVLFNTAMSPVNINNFEATPFPGYSFEWGENPVAPQMAWVTGFVPTNSLVLASDNLFPYVANNPNAYAVPWFVISPSSPVPYFPFTPSSLPTFVLVDASQFPLLPAFLQQDVFNRSLYGLVAYVYSTSFPGTVYLFEEGYTQPATSRDVVTPPTNYYFSSANLSLGPDGRIAPSSTTKFGTAIESTAVATAAGNDGIWYGPYVTLLPGTYRVGFNLTGVASNRSEPLLILDSGVHLPGFTAGNLSWSVVYPSQLSSVGWTNLEYNITLGEPYPLVEFRGFLEFTKGVPNGMVALNYIEVSLVS